MDPVTAIQMVTINPAENFHLQDQLGSITPGKIADIVFLSSLEKCSVEKVIANGELVVDDRKLTKELPAPNYSNLLRGTVKLAHKIAGDDLVLKVDPKYTCLLYTSRCV